jgi:hypothetical protein
VPDSAGTGVWLKEWLAIAAASLSGPNGAFARDLELPPGRLRPVSLSLRIPLTPQFPSWATAPLPSSTYSHPLLGNAQLLGAGTQGQCDWTLLPPCLKLSPLSSN